MKNNFYKKKCLIINDGLIRNGFLETPNDCTRLEMKTVEIFQFYNTLLN